MVFLDKRLSGKSQSGVFRGRFAAVNVAVKRIEKCNYDLNKKYVQREHKTLEELFEHENVVKYYDCQELHGMIYLALELCNTDLQNYIELNGRQNMEISLVIATQMRNGLEYLHDKGFVHRDFKPPNVLMKILGNGKIRVKICDMGISRKVNQACLTYSETGHGGSKGYVPFEVLDAADRGEKAEHLSFFVDIFSFAVTLYFMLSGGKHPFGKLDERNSNILRKKCPDLDSTVLMYEAQHLLLIMLDHCAYKR